MGGLLLPDVLGFRHDGRDAIEARLNGETVWPDVAPPSDVPTAATPIGTPIAGGFMAGVIDTIAGDIVFNDTRQVGERYALIVSPRDVGEPSSNLQWALGTSSAFQVDEAETRWDGLYATDHIINNETLSDFPIFEFCDQVRSSDPVPNDGGSDWYIPAMDELELLYRNFKPTTANNVVGTFGVSGFVAPNDSGNNPSSDPQGDPHTATDPAQTTITAFQAGNAQAFDFDNISAFFSATQADRRRAWIVGFFDDAAGVVQTLSKDLLIPRCRLVRRFPL